MGTIHYAAIQTKGEDRWFTQALFYFGKEYELFRFLHKEKPGAKLYPSMDSIEDIPEELNDMHYYQTFDTTEVACMLPFRYEEDKSPCYLFEGLLATFVRLPGDNNRIIICQDQ